MSRILAISDIHGMYDEFVQLLEIVKFDPDYDQLVLLGDYIDRGPEPVKVVHKVMELVSQGAIALTGNHESMFLEFVDEVEHDELDYQVIHHDNNGMKVTWDQFTQMPWQERNDFRQFISKLPKFCKVGEHTFVHAGYNPNLPMEKQSVTDLLWIREDFIRRNIPDGTKIVFGHTPTVWHRCKIWYGKNKIGIDCAAVFGERLACLEIKPDGYAEHYVECSRKRTKET